MKKCFIFGALPVNELFLLPQKDDFVIAADRGFITVNELNITPVLVVGDFDSLGYEPLAVSKIVLPTVKDDTDLCVALKYALDKGFRDIYVFGAADGKTDHTFANIALAANVSRMGARCIFFGSNTHFTAVTNSKIEFNGAKGRVSVFGFGGDAFGVTLTGFEYNLENATLESFVPLGVSNSFKKESCKISVKEGTLIVMWEDKTLPRF